MLWATRDKALPSHSGTIATMRGHPDFWSNSLKISETRVVSLIAVLAKSRRRLEWAATASRSFGSLR